MIAEGALGWDIPVVDGVDWLVRCTAEPAEGPVWDPPSEGLPDGLTLDRNGRLWLAVHGAGEIRCYSPEGTVLTRVALPISGATSCSFGGPDMTDLFVTAVDDEGGPGGLFRVRTSASGRPPFRFRS